MADILWMKYTAFINLFREHPIDKMKNVQKSVWQHFMDDMVSFKSPDFSKTSKHKIAFDALLQKLEKYRRGYKYTMPLW